MPEMTQNMEFSVSGEDSGGRLDRYLAMRLHGKCSRTAVRGLIDSGRVRIGGKEVKPRYAVKEGDVINVEIPPEEGQAPEPEDIPLKVLYEDESLLVLDKPHGMVVHPGAGNGKGTVVNALLGHCGRLPDTGDPVRPGIVHRLDKDTSGVMVAAKNTNAIRSLSGQFKERTIKKEYLAVVTGKVEMDNGEITAPVSRQVLDRKKMSAGFPEGKNARTVYHVIERFEKFTLLRLDLHTGRTHQIRAHMRYLGNPVAGDTLYGGGSRPERQALHAEKLAFTHPETGERMEFVSPLPGDIKAFIEEIRKEKAK